ncbi:hypothetical protein [Pseudoxanthomonas sp. 10H]|uniref:hypothetical protein n=1 Tax=Pseudoxanthomonas sp. 10H TaxID=3242729 RepID=UPI0035582E80
MSNKKKLEYILRAYEAEAEKLLKEAQSVQTFGGTLKVDLDRVYVDQKDGRRALELLRSLKPERFAKAG